MNNSRLILPTGSMAYRMLSAAAENCKGVIFAGLPGVGKTLMLQQMALLSHFAGRRVHLLQWDIARQSFETPEILARYPEVDGTTHAAIRKAAGFWVRGVVAEWAEAHGSDAALLLGEAPFVGNRLVELAWREADAAERFLAAPTTEFIIPAPTLEVRQAIESQRAQEMERPRHVREAANAPPNVLELLMQELRGAGAVLGVPGATDAGGYDPDVYVAIYARLLELRHARALIIDECWPVVSSPYDLDIEVTELRPNAVEVAAAMARVEAIGPVEVERAVKQWFRPVPA